MIMISFESSSAIDNFVLLTSYNIIISNILYLHPSSETLTSHN